MISDCFVTSIPNDIHEVSFMEKLDGALCSVMDAQRDFGRVQTLVLFFAACEPKFTKVSHYTRDRFYFATLFSDCRCLVPFQRYSSKIIYNWAKMLTFLLFMPQVKFQGPQILGPSL